MTPKTGQIVRIIQGRDQNKVAVIIEIIDDRFVLIADGDKRKYDRPKKKNINHLELTPFISEEVRESLLETGRVSNQKLRLTVANGKRIVTDCKERRRRQCLKTM